MVEKFFILNADDLGMNKAVNRAVLEGYSGGILKSASLVANGSAFEEAWQYIIPSCAGLGVGVHLNITEGNSLCPNLELLTDGNGNFNNSYSKLLLKSFNYANVSFMAQVESEFRAQIEAVLKVADVSHIDSHMHVHSIPRLFDLVCTLAEEYKIPQVRSHYEDVYIIPDVVHHLNFKYPLNLLKLLLLNFFTLINESTLEKSKMRTNDNLIGVTYASMMNSLTVSCGLKAIKFDRVIAEALIHPCRYEDGTIDGHFAEFQLTLNQKLKDKIEKLGYKITNYRELYECATKTLV